MTGEDKSKSSEISDEQATLEAVRLISSGKTLDSMKIPDELRLRIRGVLARAAGMDEAPNAKVDHGTTISETKELLISNLKVRFEAHPERHAGIEWAEADKSLRAHPEKLDGIQWMEETGGEPDVLEIEGNSFVFVDFSAESPSGRLDLNYHQSIEKAKESGVELMTEDQYYKLCKFGKFDENSYSWLKRSPDDKNWGYPFGFGGEGEYLTIGHEDGDFQRHNMGFRCALSVPKII